MSARPRIAEHDVVALKRPIRSSELIDDLVKHCPSNSEGTAAEQRIAEQDIVALKGGVPIWPAGIHGTVVSDHGSSKLIEISDDRGQMLDLIEVAEKDLELVERYPSKF